MKKNLFLIIFLLTNISVFAQTRDIAFTKKEFPNRNKELEIAKTQIKNGEIKIIQKDYDEALKLLLKAYNFNPNNSILNFDIGYCYFKSTQKFKSLEYFEKAFKLNPNISIPDYKNINYYLGRSYHLNSKFEEAITYYKIYLSPFVKKPKNDDKNSVLRNIEECENGKILLKDTLNVIIKNLGENVNSSFKEYAPCVVSDGSKIYFTSRRKGTGGAFAEDRLYYEDIYETNLYNDSWSKAKNLGTPLNTRDHDAIVGLSPDGSQLFIYVANNGGDIYVSKLKGSRWLKPEPLSEKINTKYHESKACLSYDNKILYFISNRPDLSIGGKDIFYSTIDKDGNWSEAKNLGNKINTKYDEIDFFVHPDGRTIYFSSQGHNSMGGFDIFKTTRDENGEWQTPINLGFPINTPDDDVFFVTTASGKKAYFSSVRPEGYGDYDLYEINFPEEKKITKDSTPVSIVHERVLVTLIKGTVTDANTKLPLEANIDIMDLVKKESVATFLTNSQSGKYIVNLPSGRNYGINVNKEGYLFHSENFNLPDTADYQEFVIDIELNRIEVGTTITLKNIFFDYDKATLRSESFVELNNVIDILNKYPKMKIEISGHTDNKGSAEYNKNLSYERAKTIVNYLIEKEISKDRLSYEGYGFEQPIATNETDEGRQINRRVEFKIIEK
ncbi:MAG: OmpA family protein [Bacteroidales bacterium]|jgi:outer membrane protein OmpA-like peptidoglycan-associated protein|nr:OmpA family protein [Bacteroidales bacterium]